jgi:MFS family permease
MIRRIRTQLRFGWEHFPRQFWLLFFGMLISTTGASMVWPFLMIYVSEKLQLPLTSVTTLLTLNAAMGLLSTFLAGPVIDRAGRKKVMVASLALDGLAMAFLSQASTLPAFAILMGLRGAINPLYRVGADAMMADLIPKDLRPDAYSLLRMSNNIGIAIGPAVGGFLVIHSYGITFMIAAVGLVTYSLMLAFLARETLPAEAQAAREPESFGGYGRVFSDRKFIAFVSIFTANQVCAALIWVLLGVYAKHNFGVPENQYGWLATTNAVMVVFLQITVTQQTKRFPPLNVLALGAFLYASAVGSIALGQSFWAFWASMVAMTFGELMLVPTSNTYAANMAPIDMRGRYMSLYGITWGIASGVGPLFGGILSDHFGPRSTWVGGFLVGMLGVAGFLLLARRARRAEALPAPTLAAGPD